jgi:hypothetical protein
MLAVAIMLAASMIAATDEAMFRDTAIAFDQCLVPRSRNRQKSGRADDRRPFRPIGPESWGEVGNAQASTKRYYKSILYRSNVAAFPTSPGLSAPMGRRGERVEIGCDTHRKML